MDALQKLGNLRDTANKEASTQLALILSTLYPQKDKDDFNLLDFDEQPNKPLVLSDELAQRICTLCGIQYIYDNEYNTGGEGIVIRVRNGWTGRREILKIASNLIRETSKRKTRFLRGAKIQGYMKNKLLFGVPETYSINWDFVYYTMEYIAGETLLNFLAKVLDEKLVLNLFIKVLDLLAEIHRRKIIHRDLKPQNFKVIKHPIQGTIEPILLDWGLSKNIENQAESLTGIGTEMGTPAYVSDDQWEDAANATFSDDIFSAGKLFYVFLTYQKLKKLPEDKHDYYPEKYLAGIWQKIYYVSTGARDVRYPTTTAMANSIRKELGLPLKPEPLLLDVEESKISEHDTKKILEKTIETGKIKVQEKVMIPESEKLVDLDKIDDEIVKKFLLAVDKTKRMRIKK